MFLGIWDSSWSDWKYRIVGVLVHIVLVTVALEGIGLVEVDTEFGKVVAAVVDTEFDIVVGVEFDKLGTVSDVQKRRDLLVMAIAGLVSSAVK